MEAGWGFELVLEGWKQSQEDKLYLKWLHDHSEKSFLNYKNEIMGDGYRKSTDEEKEQILKRFGVI